MHPNRVCRDQNRHNRAATADDQSKLVEIQAPRYRQLARNYSAFVRPASCMRGCGLTPQILHRRITRKVHHCPSQPRGSALVRPGASAFYMALLVYVFKPPTSSVPLLNQIIPSSIVSSRIESSRRVAIAVLSYYRRCYRRSQAVIKKQFPSQRRGRARS